MISLTKQPLHSLQTFARLGRSNGWSFTMPTGMTIMIVIYWHFLENLSTLAVAQTAALIVTVRRLLRRNAYIVSMNDKISQVECSYQKL